MIPDEPGELIGFLQRVPRVLQIAENLAFAVRPVKIDHFMLDAGARQDQLRGEAGNIDTTHAADNSQGTAGSQSLNGSGAKGAAGAKGSSGKDEPKVNFGAPGSSWNTKKFTDEYDREYAKVVDKDWTRECTPSVQVVDL